jgi:hypothetical protein
MARRLMTKQVKARMAVRAEVWPDAEAWMWPPAGAKGWSKVPRTLAIILQILKDKRVRVGKEDPGPVYIELMTHPWDDGLIEIQNEKTHADHAGYTGGERGVRSWRERMSQLEELGFIKIAPRGSMKYGYAMLVNPYLAVEALNRQGKVEKGWWLAFKERWTKESGEEPAVIRENVDIANVVLGDFAKSKKKESA